MSNKLRRARVLLSVIAYGAIGVAFAHGSGPWAAERLMWHTAQIERVIGGGSPTYSNPHDVEVQGRKCIAGRLLNFDVRDDYAFDIDETVQVDIEFFKDAGERTVRLTYDRNDGAPAFNSNSFVSEELVQNIGLPVTPFGFWRTSIPLVRARFANGGFAGTDLTLSADRELVVCSVELKRSNNTRSLVMPGTLIVDVLDEAGTRTPARMGIYDKSGRLPLPGEAAIMLRSFNNTSRIVSMRPGSTSWPTRNRSVFYADGRYQAALPPGDYDVFISKGLEYRIAHATVRIRASETQKISIPLKRWTHANSHGWYSGDVHIHYARESMDDNTPLLRFIEAEDLNLGNILQMGNSAQTYFHQYDWRTISNETKTAFALVPGQEDPRNSRSGHTIHLNVSAPVRNPAEYPLFYKVFERTRAQGAITGYAHVWADVENSPRAGLALDVPFGLVDFVEVLQLGTGEPGIWFDFLNLGYKLSPAAGTDYPYADVPGAVRNYVYLGKTFSPRAWLDGLRRGHTFVTNGPLLRLTVNGRAMGSDVYTKRGDPLLLEATATINPDIDLLDRLEIIEQGQIVKAVSSTQGSSKLTLRFATHSTHGSWFVLRALGKRAEENASVVGLSAPVYVYVDGHSFWKPSAVREIVQRLKSSMQTMLVAQREKIETWDTDEPDTRNWEVQKWLLQQRIDEASSRYDELVQRATLREYWTESVR